MRILFMGTPDFAVASLRRLVEDGHEICGVFTQPDRPKNRGHKLMFSPVKQYAVEQGLTVYQPLKMKDGTALATVRELNPDASAEETRKIGQFFAGAMMGILIPWVLSGMKSNALSNMSELSIPVFNHEIMQKLLRGDPQ